jgi:hypothetical protein
VGQVLGLIFRVPDPLVFKGPCLESTSCNTSPLTTTMTMKLGASLQK